MERARHGKRHCLECTSIRGKFLGLIEGILHIRESAEPLRCLIQACNILVSSCRVGGQRMSTARLPDSPWRRRCQHLMSRYDSALGEEFVGNLADDPVAESGPDLGADLLNLGVIEPDDGKHAVGLHDSVRETVVPESANETAKGP